MGIAVRTHPLQLEFHQRNVADGFRVSWNMPKVAPLGAVDMYVQEAKRMMGTPPTIIGYGITSDPVRDCSYDSLFIAVQTTIMQPWLAMNVDPSSCNVQECSGFVLRKMKLNATGECVTERVTVNEESGEVTYNKCQPNGEPGATERVLAIHRAPLRIELFERNFGDGMRQSWTAPAPVAVETFGNIVQLAKKLESKAGETIGYGIASKPMTGMTQDDLWKAMLYSVKNPDKCGMKVDSVKTKDVPGYMQKPGYLQRSMRLLEKAGTPTVTDNIRVFESAQEITYRPVEGGKESDQERVFALRTDPLRCEMFCRNAADKMRMDWIAPQAVANEVFNSVTSGVQSSSAPTTGVIGMGWTSAPVVGATSDNLWEALVFGARNPQQFMDVSDVSVTDCKGFLSRVMTVNASGKVVTEHIYASERKGEMVYRVVDAASGMRETEDERVIAVKDEPLRLEFFHRNTKDGYRVMWQAPISACEKMVNDVIAYAAQIQVSTQKVVGLGVRSDEIKDVAHDDLWRAMLKSIREPQAFFQCSGVSIKDCNGFVQRTMTANGETYTENIYEDELSCELVYRKLVFGAEADTERVIAVRTHPLQLEFHQRNVADGFRVSWDMPKVAPLGAVEMFVKEAKRMMGAPPSIIGYGITSDPIRGCSYDSLFIAVQNTIRQPWMVINVDEGACDVKEVNGIVERQMKLNATGEVVVERVTVNEEVGEITF